MGKYPGAESELRGRLGSPGHERRSVEPPSAPAPRSDRRPAAWVVDALVVIVLVTLVVGGLLYWVAGELFR